MNGTDPDLKPCLFMAHIDVVPVESIELWEKGPFSGEISQDGFVHGRGTIDCKGQAIGLLESMEFLLQRNDFHVRRTIFISLGGDEETGGVTGAQMVAKYLSDIKLEMVHDEGGFIILPDVFSTTKPIALITTAEKGYLSINLSSSNPQLAGHSSLPKMKSNIGNIVLALNALLETKDLFVMKIDENLSGFLSTLGEHSQSLFSRILLQNQWLFSPLILNEARASAELSALVRTTLAITMIGGGVKENVLPTHTWAVINLRLKHETIESAINKINQVVRRFNITASPIPNDFNSEASPQSSTKTMGWQIVEQAIRGICPNCPIVSSTGVGATDARYFYNHTATVSADGTVQYSVYRFHPIRVSKADIPRVHGTNERIHKSDFENIILFYTEMFRAVQSHQLRSSGVEKHDEI